MEKEWFLLGLGGFEPHNNFLYFTGMPIEIYCNKWKDCLSEEREKIQHVGKFISSLKKYTWQKKIIFQQRPKLNFFINFFLLEKDNNKYLKDLNFMHFKIMKYLWRHFDLEFFSAKTFVDNLKH